MCIQRTWHTGNDQQMGVVAKDAEWQVIHHGGPEPQGRGGDNVYACSNILRVQV